MALTLWQGVGVRSGEAVITDSFIALPTKGRHTTHQASASKNYVSPEAMIFRRVQSKYYAECPSVWVSLMFSHNWTQIISFWQESRLFLFGRNHTEVRHMLLIYPMSRYFNFDHLIEEVFVRFLLGK